MNFSLYLFLGIYTGGPSNWWWHQKQSDNLLGTILECKDDAKDLILLWISFSSVIFSVLLLLIVHLLESSILELSSIMSELKGIILLL